jgi:hypothetical protein
MQEVHTQRRGGRRTCCKMRKAKSFPKQAKSGSIHSSAQLDSSMSGVYRLTGFIIEEGLRYNDSGYNFKATRGGLILQFLSQNAVFS